MRLISLVLIALLLLIQYPLWLGKGGWLRVQQLEQQAQQAKQKNQQQQMDNLQLDFEIQNLRNGTEALEEYARSELGMIKSDEIFVQTLPSSTPNNHSTNSSQ